MITGPPHRLTARLLGCFSLLLAGVSFPQFGLSAQGVPTAAPSPDRRGQDRLGSYGPPRKLAVLENRAISESSGLAVSRRRANIFWTHNDSGDPPRIFAFDLSGQHRGEFVLPGAEAMDWEDIASFDWRGRKMLLVADVGDNLQRRSQYALYLVEEPSSSDTVLRKVTTLPFRYEDGSRNCEAVAVDTTDNCVLLVTKSLSLTCVVYRIELPEELQRETLIAKRIAQLSVTPPTAMDISPDGRRAVVLTYGHAHEFTRRPTESWSEALSRPPRTIQMPARRQGESICYGNDGVTLYLTSEKTPTPFWEVSLEQGP